MEEGTTKLFQQLIPFIFGKVLQMSEVGFWTRMSDCEDALFFEHGIGMQQIL